jgi:hypothetical protein
MATPVLSPRELNRATLARQMLLVRRKVAPLKAIETLVGLQAQVPRAPFISLWSRLVGFETKDLAGLIYARKAIRASAMRATIHLMSRNDFIAFRRPIDPVLTQMTRTTLKGRIETIDIAARVAEGRRFLDEAPRGLDAYKKHLRALEPDTDHDAVARVIHGFLPLVRVPDDSRWAFKANAAFAPAETWLGQELGKGATVAEMMLRYLAAFGPATVADAQTWSGLRTLRPIFEELRPRLSVFRDDKGRELFDLKRAPRPDADMQAPIRFLPDYDNLLLSHADRRRVIDPGHLERVKTPNMIGVPTFLVEGFVAGAWRIERSGNRATLALKPFVRLGATTRDELEAEGRDLVAFVEGDGVAFRLRIER